MVGAGAFPVGDWQFWAVSLVALLAAAWIARHLIPRRKRSRPRRAARRRATLTVKGRPVSRSKE